MTISKSYLLLTPQACAGVLNHGQHIIQCCVIKLRQKIHFVNLFFFYLQINVGRITEVCSV